MTEAIDRGLAYLAAAQQTDGGFLSDTCHRDGGEVVCQAEQTIWMPSLISTALDPLRHDARAAGIQGRVAKFLTQEMEPEGTWRYWVRRHALFHTLSPDVDDTACAASALGSQATQGPAHLKRILAMRDQRGRLQTWMQPELLDPGQRSLIAQLKSSRGHPVDLPNDVDCVVNANALAYLAQQGHEDSAVCAYLNGAAVSGQIPRCWLYGDSPYLVYYMYARAYRMGAACLKPTVEGTRDWLVSRQGPDGSWGDDAEQAAALIGLMASEYRGAALLKGVGWLLIRQRADGSWPRTPFLNLTPTGNFHGSEALTTALSLEALGRYLELDT